MARNDLSKIGIGTWGIGGFVNKNPNNDDEKQLTALKFMFENGLNFLETGMWASNGHSAFLTSQAYKQSNLSREKVFLSQTVYQYNIESLSDVEREFRNYLDLFETDFVDALQLNVVVIKKLGYENVITLMKKYLTAGKIRYVSVTNSDLSFLEKYHQEFGAELFAHEVGFNLEVRENEDFGIIDYAQKKGILNVVYQPLRRNRTANKNYPLLMELSKKYKKTQNQIIINWIVSKGFLPITKSENIEHIKEHLSSFDFNLEREDIIKLDGFRVQGYQSPKIDWYGDGSGIPIDKLSNVFDDHIKNS